MTVISIGFGAAQGPIQAMLRPPGRRIDVSPSVLVREADRPHSTITASAAKSVIPARRATALLVFLVRSILVHDASQARVAEAADERGLATYMRGRSLV